MGKLSFGATGHSYQPSEVKLKVGGAPTCPRCTKRVYFNEEKRALGKVWHRACFQCAKCKKSLDSTNCAGHDDEIYCTMCHKRQFGPRGYGFAGGMAGLSTESTSNNTRTTSSVQTTTVPSALPTQEVNRTHPDCCPRCGKKVFHAEEVKALSRKWHRLCLKCDTCNKMLEPGRCSEHDGGVYCANCYGRFFGPSGYGFAGGAGSLLSSDPVKDGLRRNSPASSRGSSPARALNGSRGSSPLTTEKTAGPTNSSATPAQNGSRGSSPVNASPQGPSRNSPVQVRTQYENEEYVPIPPALQPGRHAAKHGTTPSKVYEQSTVTTTTLNRTSPVSHATINGDPRHSPHPVTTQNGSRGESPIFHTGSREGSPPPQIVVNGGHHGYDISAESARAALEQCGIENDSTDSLRKNMYQPNQLLDRAQPAPSEQCAEYYGNRSTTNGNYQPNGLTVEQEYRAYSPTLDRRYSPDMIDTYSPDTSLSRDVTSIRDPEIERSYSPEVNRSGSSSPYYSPTMSRKQAGTTILKAIERRVQTSPITIKDAGDVSPMNRAQPAPVSDEGYNSSRSPARHEDWTDPVYL